MRLEPNTRQDDSATKARPAAKPADTPCELARGTPSGAAAQQSGTSSQGSAASTDYLAQRTPGMGLPTPAVAGLLRQIRPATPALGLQGLARTPFLAALARTAPQPTPGLTPEPDSAQLASAWADLVDGLLPRAEGAAGSPITPACVGAGAPSPFPYTVTPAGPWTRSRLGLLPPATPATVGRGGMDAWLARLGLGSAVDTPARRDLQALWAHATQAGALREEVEAVRAEGQAAALAATRAQLEHWDVLMGHSASLEAENRRLRLELEGVEAALQRAGGERAAAAQAAAAQGELAEAEADRARVAGTRLLELAEHAGLVAAAYEAEKGTLVAELEAARAAVAEAEAAQAAARACADTSRSQLVQLETRLLDAQHDFSDAEAASAAAREAAEAASAEQARLQGELAAVRAQLEAALDPPAGAAGGTGAHDAETAQLLLQLQEAHEALYEIACGAETAQRTVRDGLSALSSPDVPESPSQGLTCLAPTHASGSLDGVGGLVMQRRLAIEAAAAANTARVHENAHLRTQLQGAREALGEAGLATPVAPQGASITIAGQQASSPAGQAAGRVAVPAFFGAHRVFMGPPPGAAPRAPASCSPAVHEAWCGVRDRLRRMRADLEDTRLAVHLFRGRSATPPVLLLAPASCQVEEQGGATRTAGDHRGEPHAAWNQGEGTSEGGENPASPAPRPPKVAVDAATQVTPLSCRGDAGMQRQRSVQAMQEAAAMEAGKRGAHEGGSPGVAHKPVSLVIRVGSATPAQATGKENAEDTPVQRLQAACEEASDSDGIPLSPGPPRRRLAAAARAAPAGGSSSEREFRRRAAALNIRISPYFKRRTG
ncbi:hypothetical protein WJX81_006696 [Elliptochloris bilobata]|uniref:Uncharacterized protein n=1 Tax=Elliptochloris bilobata TaxID=381761 RepID=A0AAW1SAN1_9CHLO